MIRQIGLLAGLIWVIPVHAALYTVGPGGTHATVQAAIDAALAGLTCWYMILPTWSWKTTGSSANCRYVI